MRVVLHETPMSPFGSSSLTFHGGHWVKILFPMCPVAPWNPGKTQLELPKGCVSKGQRLGARLQRSMSWQSGVPMQHSLQILETLVVPESQSSMASSNARCGNDSTTYII